MSESLLLVIVTTAVAAFVGTAASTFIPNVRKVLFGGSKVRLIEYPIFSINIEESDYVRSDGEKFDLDGGWLHAHHLRLRRASGEGGYIEILVKHEPKLVMIEPHFDERFVKVEAGWVLTLKGFSKQQDQVVKFITDRLIAANVALRADGINIERVKLDREILYINQPEKRSILVVVLIFLLSILFGLMTIYFLHIQ